MSKNVVVVMQQSNWEDSGGDHDPILITVDDQMFEELETCANSIEPFCSDSIREAVFECERPSLPCTLDAVFNIWYD